VPAQKLDVLRIMPSIEPSQHTPTVVGYLEKDKDAPKDKTDPERTRLVGQYVTATIFVPPTRDTVEIPAEALNEVGGQALVFVETNAAKRDYTLRRVPVQARYKDVVVIRSKLSKDDEEVSKLEQQKGRRPIEPLREGDRVITRGVVELTAALEELLVEERTKLSMTRSE